MASGGMQGGEMGTGRPYHPKGNSRWLLRHPFDLALAEDAFPGINIVADDSDLTSALLKRNSDLSPTPAEEAAIFKLVTKTHEVLDNLVLAPENSNCFHVDEIRLVGSFKKETMMRGKNVADIVVILKKLPNEEAIKLLGNKIKEDLKKLMKTESINLIFMDYGIQISNCFAGVQLMVTTLHRIIIKYYPAINSGSQIMLSHLAAVRHSFWFGENADHFAVKVLIRLLKDLRTRFDGFEPLTPWMLDLLAHYAIMNNPRNQALPISQAFKRVFQLLSAGLFLPGSSGIIDPCENGKLRVQTAMTLKQQDVCCLTAQTLLRVLSHGGYKQILGLEGISPNTKELSVWSKVVVFPLNEVHNNPPVDMIWQDVGDVEIGEKGNESMESA